MRLQEDIHPPTAMTSQLVAEEWENESPSPPPQGSLLDAAIDQLLKERPSQDNVNYSAEHREQSDLYRVNRADIECNEGDTLVIVEFPPGGLKNCYGEEVSTMSLLCYPGIARYRYIIGEIEAEQKRPRD